MPRRLFRITVALPLALACFLANACVTSYGQAPASEPGQAGIERLSGTEPDSHIQYVKLILKGSLHTAANGASDPPAPTPPPLLIAQCTLRPNGKNLFELFATFGEDTDLAFHPPWRPGTSGGLFPPQTVKVPITMDFLGYTHVKPVRRQWESPAETPGLYRYNSPGSGSPNFEEVAFYLRYLLALPTLRLTLGDRASEFLTMPLLDAIRKEPLCHAAGI